MLKFKKAVKFATFYGAVNGNNSIADVDVFSVNTGQLITQTNETPFDYSIVAGIRKIARFGYENRQAVFYNGEEHSYADAATIGKVSGFEFLFEVDWKRRFGNTFLDQQHFLRYVADKWIVKVEYMQQGFAEGGTMPVTSAEAGTATPPSGDPCPCSKCPSSAAPG